VLVLVFMAILMLWLHWQLALLVLISAPLYLIPTVRFGRRIQKLSRTQRQREGKLAAGTMEMIGAMQVVQTLALEDAFAEQFSSEEKSGVKEGVQFRRLLAKLRGTVQLMTGVSSAAVLFYGAYLVIQGELTAGSLLVFLSYLRAAFKPLANFTKYSGRIAKASAAGERVMDIFYTEPDVKNLPGAVDAPRFKGRVRFEGVEFAYEPGHPVLEAIDFEVEPGQLVALIGPSGAGKSTIVEMIPRLHDPGAGRVLIDGHDIKAFTLASLRSQISFVLQDTLLFAASIRENIAYGAPSASDEQIIAAAKCAAAHEFILAQPNGYDTVVGERGVTLSVGQRQRIAIARAAIHDAPILILDEPTTGLDEENQEIVLEALTRLAERRTTFMITHDLEHVRRADRVLVLQRGRIVASGSPSELQLSGARFAEMMAKGVG
jgi:ATP-binding cassette subfamily B protein